MRSIKTILRSPLIFGEVVLKLVLIKLGLRLFSLRTLGSKTSRGRAFFFKQNNPEALRHLEHLVALANEVTLSGHNCLQDSLLFFWMAPPPAYLRIGVAKEEAKLAAHAWIEVDGQAYLGSVDPHKYEKLLSFEKILGS